MKKKILSPEALAALATGTQLVTEPLVPEADAGDTQAGEQVETVVEGAAGEETQETEESTDVTALQEHIDGLTTDNAALQERVEALATENEDLRAAALSVDAKIKAAAEEVADYKAIVTGHITNMRTALALAAVDMTNWTSEAVLREYDSIAKAFEKALPEGSQVPDPQPKSKAAPVVVTSSTVAAKARGLGF